MSYQTQISCINYMSYGPWSCCQQQFNLIKKAIALSIVSSVQWEIFGSNIFVNWVNLYHCLVQVLINF